MCVSEFFFQAQPFFCAGQKVQMLGAARTRHALQALLSVATVVPAVPFAAFPAGKPPGRDLKSVHNRNMCVFGLSQNRPCRTHLALAEGVAARGKRLSKCVAVPAISQGRSCGAADARREQSTVCLEGGDAREATRPKCEKRHLHARRRTCGERQADYKAQGSVSC